MSKGSVSNITLTWSNPAVNVRCKISTIHMETLYDIIICDREVKLVMQKNNSFIPRIINVNQKPLFVLKLL